MSSDGYYVDYETFGLEKLKGLLRVSRLLPSQQVLKEDLDGRFAIIEAQGLSNLAHLQKALKTKTAVAAFAQETGLPVDYLTVLRREVNSYQPKPVKLADFPGVSETAVSRLEQLGIMNTKQLFPLVLTPQGRRELVRANGIDQADLVELTKLTDVARLKWVGPKFARLVVESAYDTVEKIAAADYEAFYREIMHINEEKNIYKGGLGLEDTRLWIEDVVPLVPRVIVY